MKKKTIHCTCTCKIVGKSTLSHTSNLVKLVPPSFSKACAESMYLQKKKKDRTDKLHKHYTGRYNNEK